MAWYVNHYHCSDCGSNREDEWSCCCDDECPNCGSRNWSPYASENLTEIVVQRGSMFVVLKSPDSADDKPRYAPVGQFATRADADSSLQKTEVTAL